MSKSAQTPKHMLPLLGTYVSARQDAKCAKKNIFLFVRTWRTLRLGASVSSDFRTPKFKRKFHNTFG
jgi:hypothetical protein